MNSEINIWFWLWLISWLVTMFCLMPISHTKIARLYGRWFNVKIYTSLWKKISIISMIAMVIFMVISIII